MINILDFQWISLIVFVVALTLIVIKFRKKLEIQKLLFPILYAGLFRTNFGLNFIKKFSKKFKEWIIILGYCGIGFGFLGMIIIVLSIIQAVYTVITSPAAEAGVALVLPQTTIPGLGFLPFWYWIIALFVLILIHEFSHGIVAKAHGIKIKSSGLGFFGIILPIIPLAFVEPDEKELSKREDYVQYSIFAAGPFSNILTAGIILLLFMFVLFPIDNALTEPTGFTFTKINGSYPSNNLPDNMLVKSVNGKEVLSFQEFSNEISCIQPEEEIMLNNYTIETVKGPEEQAFIGITNIENKYELKEGVNETFFNIYKWFRDLLKWIGLLSFFIGLANLLPIGPIDGGRMVKTLSEKISKNKNKAMKGWLWISMIVLGLLLVSLIYPWIRGLL